VVLGDVTVERALSLKLFIPDLLQADQEILGRTGSIVRQTWDFTTPNRAPGTRCKRRNQLELHLTWGEDFEGNEWRLRISGLGEVVSGDCCVHNNQRSVYDLVKGVGSGWKSFNPNVIQRK